MKDKDYFVVTTNVDHQFQRAGFDKKRLFYTQGDYGLFQSVNLSIQKTYDNEEWVMKAMEAQGFVKDSNGDIGLSSMCGEDGNWEWATKGDWKYWMPVSALKSFNK